jgi:hypothetical protein
MTTPLLPQAFWFRLSVPCLRVAGLPRSAGKRLLDLPDACRLPQTAVLDGKDPWAEVRVAWNPDGLAVAVEAEGNLAALADDDRPDSLYGVQVWVDTRDTRDVSRATRFCHRFDARLTGGAGKTGLGVKVSPRDIARAVATPPLCDPALIPAKAERTKKGWRLELFLPAGSLHGFDPETNRRLGFAYQVTDPERPDEFLGVGREFPVGENPSLWSTLELIEPK